MSHADEKPIPARAFHIPLWSHLLCRWADRIAVGHLTLEFPDGRRHHVRSALPGPSASLRIRRPASLVRKLATGGGLGLARGYVDGDWDTADLGALLKFGHANEAALAPVLQAPRLAKALAYLRHRTRSNTRGGSRRNIAFHYDLGNDFYRQWLDETMTYSAGLFSSADQSLAGAQRAKYARIVDELGIGPDDQVLEIGCGWGGFADYAAREIGCRVTALTLSREQAEFARDRLAAAGLSDRVEIRLQDYRDCPGEFDKVVSIEMFEAVGEENWPVYFDVVRERLKPGGRAMIQVITIADAHFAHYRRNADFIQTYIFPGGMLPSYGAFAAVAADSGLTIRDSHFFGADYERTLLHWDRSFAAAWHRIENLGFDARFKRMWRYYLHYCAVGFRTGRIDVGQFHLERA